MNMFMDRIKNFLIISAATVLLYCYALYARTEAQIAAACAQITIEPPSALIRTDLDVLNTYFQKQLIVVKKKEYRDGILVWEADYDRAGNEIKDVRYKTDGSIAEWTEYEYSADEKATTCTWYLEDGSVNFRREYRYDDAGNLIESTEYNSSGNIAFKSTYIYDEEGNRIESVHYGDYIYERYEYDEAGNVIKVEYQYHDLEREIENTYTYQYRYNEAGDIEKEICYDEDGNVSFWAEYQYDEAGNQLSEISYNYSAYRDIHDRKEYRYDKNGKKIQEVILTGDSMGDSIISHEYCYDEWGNQTGGGSDTHDYEYEYEYETLYTSRQPGPPVIVCKKEYHDGTLASQIEYDRTGNEIGKIIYDSGGNILKQIEYTYDRVGNLIEQTEKKNGTTVTRKDTYTYNELGDRTEHEVYFGGELDTRCEYEYDWTGRKTGYTVYDKDGDICSYAKHKYEYDETGNVISDTEEFYEAVMPETERYHTSQLQYEYDEAGRKVKQIYYWDGRMFSWLEWEYDEKGRMLVEIEYNSDGKIIQEIWTKSENPEEETALITECEYIYDAYGKLIEERWNGKPRITYEYEE